MYVFDEARTPTPETTGIEMVLPSVDRPLLKKKERNFEKVCC